MVGGLPEGKGPAQEDTLSGWGYSQGELLPLKGLNFLWGEGTWVSGIDTLPQ